MSEWDRAKEFDWEGQDDVTSLSEEELRAQLESLSAQEREISYRRRILQGRIDLIRSELVRRGNAALSAEQLARLLMDGSDPSESPGHLY